MNAILEKIFKLRRNTALNIDCKNTNRYRIVIKEFDGSKTAYYFSTPIYNNNTGKTVDLTFHSIGEKASFAGSNSSISIYNGNLCMENAEGSCLISLNTRARRVSEREVICDNMRITPTTNGIALKIDCRRDACCTFMIETSKPFSEIRANNKYFALMSEHFRPFMTVSCIGTLDSNENIISAANLTYQKVSDDKYSVTISPCSKLGKAILIEANLYEPKLFQDTTVESKNPKMNNAFGSVGFIGTTNECGEQWLYARPDLQKMAELNGKRILRAILHVPKLNNSSVNLSISKVMNRFCSFGSTWNNKVAQTSQSWTSNITDRYIDLDLTNLFSDIHGRLSQNEGFILKTQKNGNGFSVIATADNYLTPQILEINYR